MLIDIEVPRPSRRWHLQLRDRLRLAGHAVALVPVDGATGVGGLAALEALENRLYRPARGGGESRMVDIAADSPGPAVDLVIDLAGRREPASGAETPWLVPLFDGAPGDSALIAPLLDGCAPEIVIALCEADGVRPLARGMAAIEEPHRVIRSLDRVCARLVDLLVVAVARHASGAPPEGSLSWRTHGGLGPITLAAAGLRHIAGRVAERVQRLASQGHEWRIAWRHAQSDGLIAARRGWPAAPYRVLPDDGKRYYADPFLFAHEGRTWLFCEEFPFATGRGLLSAVEMGPLGPVGTPRPVLEQSCHLSYPQVFAHQGAIYMVPETSARRTVELWRAERWPDRWVQVATLIDGLALADATLIRHMDAWWIFAAPEADGQSSWDTLALFMAERLEGPWRPHPLNPVVIDSRSARPAGRMWMAADALWRPVQDCSAGYGSRLGLARVTRLDSSGFEQEVAVSLPAPAGWRARGVHTLDALAGFEVVDVLAPPSLELGAALV